MSEVEVILHLQRRVESVGGHERLGLACKAEHMCVCVWGCVLLDHSVWCGGEWGRRGWAFKRPKCI